MANVPLQPKDRSGTASAATLRRRNRSGLERHPVTPEDLAPYYRKNGQRVVRTDHAHWFTPSSTAWSIFPYREYPHIDQRDHAQLWKAWRGAVVVRSVQTDPPVEAPTRRSLGG